MSLKQNGENMLVFSSVSSFFIISRDSIEAPCEHQIVELESAVSCTSQDQQNFENAIFAVLLLI